MSAAAKCAFSNRSAAALASSAIGAGRCSNLFNKSINAVVTCSSCPHFNAHDPSISNAACLVTRLFNAAGFSKHIDPRRTNNRKKSSSGCRGRNTCHKSISNAPAMTCTMRSRCSSHFHSTSFALAVVFFFPLAPGAGFSPRAMALFVRASFSHNSHAWKINVAYALSAER